MNDITTHQDSPRPSPRLQRRVLHAHLQSSPSVDSQRSTKMSRLQNMRRTVRQTIRGKKVSPKNKIFLKRTEFLNYSIKHVKELEEAMEYFDVIKKSYSDPEFVVQMDDSLRETFVVFQSSFKEFEDIINFQKNFNREIGANIDKPLDTLNILRTSSCEMKFRYSNYTRSMEKCLFLIKKHHSYFKEIRQHTKSKLMINDELSRPTRGVPNLKLYFTDFIKCANKDGKEEEARVYNEMLEVLDNIGKTIDDAMLLHKIRGLPEDFKIEDQGCCVKSGKISLIRTYRGFLRKMLGMSATIKFSSGYLFLFQKCLIICKKMEPRKNSNNNRRKEKFQLQALIHVPDLLDFLDHDYNEDDASLKIVEKETNIAHVINFESEDIACDWNDKIIEQASMYSRLMNDLSTE